jgi:hypothetical protein
MNLGPHWFADADFPVERFARAWLREQLNQLQARHDAMDTFLRRYPEFLESTELRHAVIHSGRWMAEQMGRPDLGNHPLIWSLVCAAWRARDAAEE